MAPNPMAFITACLPCFPRSKAAPKPSLNGSHRGEYYNTQLRSNLGMPPRPDRPERALRLPVIVGAGASNDDDDNKSVSESNNGQHQQRITINRQQPSGLNAGNTSVGATSASASRRVARRGRFPTTPSSGGDAAAAAKNKAAPAWSETPMEEQQLTELFDKLAAGLSHVPYAICGRGALVDHGLSTRPAKQVSILLPRHSKDVVVGWAKSSGWIVRGDRTSSNGDNGNGNGVFVGIPLASDGSLRQLRVKYLDDEQFEQLERVRARIGNAAWVLSLTSQLDHLAAAWSADYQRYSKRQQKEEQEAASAAGGDDTMAAETAAAAKKKRDLEKQLNEIARDILWTLSRIAAQPASARNYRMMALLPTLSSEAFFVPFTERYPAARPEMAKAGVDVAGVLAGLRDRAALREHDELLASHGAAPLVARRRATNNAAGRAASGSEVSGACDGDSLLLPFDHMRDLNQRKSIYTIATNLSVNELGGGLPSAGLPPVPAPLPKAFIAEKKKKKASGGSSSSRFPIKRSRSGRASGEQRPVAAAPKEERNSGLARSASQRPPPRTSMIPQAPEDAGRKSSDFI